MFSRIAAVILIALSLAGCASMPGPLGDAVRALTATVTNPVDATTMYQVDNTYAAALVVAEEYRTYCWSKPYRVLMATPIAKSICARRREVVRVFDAAGRNAKTAIATAKEFIAQHPTLSAATSISDAWAAVANFKAAVPATKL